MHIEWDDQFTGGIEEIDEQHKDLIIIYNQLVDECVANQSPVRPAYIVVLLTDKIKEHCQAEEQLLAAHGYPKAQHHAADHGEFIRSVEDLQHRFLTGGNPDLKIGSVMAIGKQLLEHTASDDLDAFDYVNASANPWAAHQSTGNFEPGAETMSTMIVDAAKAASERWQSFFNAGDAAGCASCYEDNAVMVAKPFGEFVGRDAILAFWQKIIADGFADVTYMSPTLTAEDAKSVVLTSDWTMNNAHGVITRELWVQQNDGKMKLREDHFEVAG